MNEKEYLSETELMELIESVEKEPLLKAPSYLKEQILFKVSKKESLSRQKQNAFFIFSAKVAAGAAAAIALLFLLPDPAQYDRFPNNAAVFYKNEHSLIEGLNEKTAQFCNFINDTANSIFIKEDD